MQDGTINKIDAKIDSLIKEKIAIENSLTGDKKVLQKLLTAEVMGEAFDQRELDNLRSKIEGCERKIKEINNTVEGLQLRKKEEENNLKNNKINQFKVELKKVSLEIWKNLRQRLNYQKGIANAEETIRKYSEEHRRIESELTNLGVPAASVIFTTPESWFSHNAHDDIKRNKRAAIRPEDDLVDGPAFLDHLIEKLEKEVRG